MNPFELSVNPGKVQAAVMGLGWCLKDDFLELHKQHIDAGPAWMVICVVPEGRGQGRNADWHIVPVKQMMQYVSFHKSGKNKIHAFLTWGSKKKIKKYIDEREYVIDFDGDLRRHSGRFRSTEPQEVTVDVSADLFAKEPPKWEKDWVEYLIPFDSKDECAFRKKRIFAYTIQPPLVALVLLIRSIFHLGVLIGKLAVGFHEFQWEALKDNPFHGVDWVWFGHGTGHISQKSPILFLVMPINYVVLFGLTALLGVGAMVTGFQLFIGLVFASGLSLFLHRSLSDHVKKKMDKKVSEWLDACFESLSDKKDSIDTYVKERHEKAEEKQKAKTFMAYSNMICDQKQPGVKPIIPTRIEEIPKENLTVTLIASSIKSKVCRPFSN